MKLNELYKDSYYYNKSGMLINMNCLDGMKLMDDNTVDLTVTSPPYDDLRKYKGYSFDFEPIARELYRITKEGGVVVWVVGDATIKGDETGTSFTQALYFKNIGFNLFDTMIYQKDGCGACGSNKSYIQSFEYMFVLTKGNIKTYNLLYDRSNKKVVKNNITNGSRNKNITKTRVDGKEFGRRFNIWNYSTGNNTSSTDKIAYKHPAIFPEQLAQDHILSWSNEGDIVFDPFMGSGTTAKMASLNNRKWIGFEMSEEYCGIIKERMENI